MSNPIGFVGLGSMGLPIARNLLAAGNDLVIYNRTASKAESLVESGARLAATPSATVSPGGIVFSIVSDDQALDDVCLGSGGILEKIGPGGIHVSMSTVAPATATRLAIEHDRRGSFYVAAPVFGRPQVAAAGELRICLAGRSEAKERVRPLLAPLGQQVIDFGEDPASASLVKLMGNFLLISMIESVSEAFALLRAYGIAPNDVLGLLPMFQDALGRYGDRIAGGRFHDVSFQLVLGRKDSNLIVDAAAAKGLTMPVAEVAKEHYDASLALGRGDLDWSAIALLVAERAGLPVADI